MSARTHDGRPRRHPRRLHPRRRAHRLRPRRPPLRRRPARPATPSWPRTRDSLAGKILRITPDGDPAPGNPDPDSPVWSLGHRNVQGLAWDDEGRLWASEFGDSELGRAQPHREGRQLRLAARSRVPAAMRRTSTRSSCGRSTRPRRAGWPSPTATCGWRACAASACGASRSPPTGRRRSRRAFFGEEYGRLRTVAVAPDGLLWLTTSNRDGRGEPDAGRRPDHPLPTLTRACGDAPDVSRVVRRRDGPPVAAW